MQSEPVISMRNVAFSYGGLPVLEEVCFSVGPREAVCMVGPNGGGKTTLVKLMLGLLTPQRGEVRLFGQSPRRSRRRVGYMPQHMQYDPRFPISVLDVVLMGQLSGGTLWYSRSDRWAAIAALEQVDMARYRRQSFCALSGGQRQRVLIARALCCEPELLVLDEPTANIDTLGEARLIELLEELNRQMAIIMVSHDLGIVSGLVERVICVNRRVATHPTDELTGESIRNLYGGDVRLVRHDKT